MRYKLVLENKEANSFPIDYPYMLKDVIERYSEAYFLEHPENKEMALNMISYSPFLAKHKTIDGENNKITLLSQRLYWILSSPVDEHITSCARNLFINKKVELLGKKLTVTGILKMNQPEFHEKMKFICLSPISVIKQIINQRKNFIYYEYDENISPVIKETLEHRYRDIFGKEPPKADLKITFDNEYITRRNGRVTKLVNIVEKDGFVRKVKAIFAPFEIEAHPELIRLAYYTGFGDFTSLGFGIVDIVNQEAESGASS